MGEDDRHKGLYQKYEVRRTDGSSEPGGKHEGCQYFVLDMDHDPYAVDALEAYMKACYPTYRRLAEHLRIWVTGRRSGVIPLTKE
jgi:hypothetical protein